MKTVKIRADLWRLTPLWAVAGTRGSFGSCRLSLELSPQWKELSKRVTFFPADGSDAVCVSVQSDEVRVPDEVMACAGTASYVIDGISETGEALVSARGELRIIDTAEPGGAEALEHTPTEAEQIRAELAALRRELRELKEAQNGIEVF